MLYYADRISDNIRKREPEGYLICVNVPIARSGTQEYLQDEIGQSGEETISVLRPEEEVFSQATIASFEGMPVTNDHPDTDEGVTADNVQWLQKGHCQNVHRGTGSESDMLVADLLITDPATIQAVLDGKREISCGYTYMLCEEDGKFVQRQIRGNHVAIVDRGRAGHRVCIKDSYPTTERRPHKMAKTKHGILAKMLAAFARDAEPEEIEEAVEAIDEIVSEPVEETPVKTDNVHEKLDAIVDLLQNPPEKEPAVTDEEPVEKPAEEPVVKDGDPDKLDTVIDLLKQLLAAKVADEEPEEVDPLQKLEDDLAELEGGAEEVKEEDADEVLPEEEEEFVPDEDPAEPESRFVDPEEINEGDEDEVLPEEEKPAVDKRTCDAMRAAIKAVKPLIAKLPPSERKAASDAAAASIRKSYGLSGKAVRNDYLKLRQRKAKAKDNAASQREAEYGLAKRIMEKRNANYSK